MKHLLKLNALATMLAVMFMLAYIQGAAQGNRLSQLVQQNKVKENVKTLTPFKVSRNESIFTIVQRGTVLTVNENDLKQIMTQRSNTISLTIPAENRTSYQLELVKAYIGDRDGFMDVTIKGKHQPRHVKISSGLNYRGIIKGNNNSYAAISIHENNIIGIISEGSGNMVLQPLKDTKDQYIFYNDRDLIQPKSADCGLTDNMYAPGNNIKGGDISTMATNTDCKVVKFYYECDFQMYQDFGNDINNVVTFITDAFTQAQTLFFNEGVITEIANPIVVWDASDYILDKYSIWGQPPADMFPVLSTIVAETGSYFEGDIANFVTTRVDIHPGHPFGLAQVINGLCNKYESHILIDIDDYNVQPVPNFSLMVFIMAHEAGHIMGSPHTHACAWNGNNTALDNCVPVEPPNGCSVGSPPPSIYTVMSYCSLPDFQAGFGPQPGGLIYTNVSNAPCLDGSTQFIPVNLSFDSGQNKLLWDPVAGASQYQVQFKLDLDNTCEFDNQWITQDPVYVTEMDLTAIQPNPLMSATEYVWRVRADCSPYSDEGSFTTQAGPCDQRITYDITAHSAILCWDDCNSPYDIRVKGGSTNGGNWVYFNSIENYLRVMELDVVSYIYNQTYEWQVKSTSSGVWGGSTYFTTTDDTYGYGPYSYCSSNGSDPANYYITRVAYGSYSNLTGSSATGYGNYLQYIFSDTDPLTFVWSPANNYQIDATAPSPSTDQVFLAGFIDWNKDGDYTDEHEDVFRYFEVYNNIFTSGALQAQSELPTEFTPGFTRLRICYNAPFTSAAAPIAPHQCGDNGSGEVEDYNVFVYLYPTCGGFRLSPTMNSDIMIFPNPASDFIKLYINDMSEPMTASIYNVTGQCVKKFQVVQETSEIDISSFPQGLYQISVSQNNTVQKNVKFIKL